MTEPPGLDDEDYEPDPRTPLQRVRNHLGVVALLEVALIVVAARHQGLWYEDRLLLALVFLQGALAAPWSIVTPFLVSSERPAAALLVVLIGAPLNVWLRYLGYKHGLAESREARQWRASRPKPWEED